MSEGEVARRVRDLEHEALEVRPPATRGRLDLERLSERRRDEDAEVGGLLSMLVGLVMMVGGLLLYASRLVVWGGFGIARGGLPVGMLFITFVAGVALAFARGRTVRLLGLVIAGVSVVGFFVASLTNAGIFFRPTPLLDILAILALVGLGLGLVARGARRL